MRTMTILLTLWLLVGIASAQEPQEPQEVQAGQEPQAGQDTPQDLLAFMAGYCEAILHLRTNDTGEVVADYWKVDAADEKAKVETLAYVEARKLLEVAAEQVVFLRVMSEQERAEFLSSAMPIHDPKQQEFFERPTFKYALVRLVPVVDGSLEFQNAVPDVAPPPARSYSLEEFKALVEDRLQMAPAEEPAEELAEEPTEAAVAPE